MERGMPMAVCRMGKGSQKGGEFLHRMSRKYARQNNGMCESVEHLRMLL